MRLNGIHHITAITGDAPRNVDYYTRVLGLRLIAKTVNQSVDWVSRSWKHHAFPAALPTELLDVMVEEERWVARNQKREPRSRAALQALIDTTVLAEARR